MPDAVVNGLKIAYELHGDGDPVALTPGGRFSMDTPGVRELALELAGAGRRVLIWDRPNTGASDVSFDGESEATLHADTLAGLIETLDLGRTSIIGGSNGSRCSLTTVIRHPEIADKLAVWWTSGGYFHYVFIAGYYWGDSWLAAKRGGMEAVVELAIWQETLAKNPANRERLLAMDPVEFAAKAETWAPELAPCPDSPLLGIRAEDLAQIRVPTLVFRGSPTDFFHHRHLTERLHELIPGSRLVEPPWDDEEWNERSDAYQASGVNNLFAGWPQLAPQLLDFMNAAP
jgi:pimeloyl-ACP methyl ester carboxylesterase